MKHDSGYYICYVKNQPLNRTFIQDYSVIYRDGDLPSIIKFNDNKQKTAEFYCNKGVYHRTHGPVIIYYDAATQKPQIEVYFLYNKKYEKEEFEDELFKIRLNQLDNETKQKNTN